LPPSKGRIGLCWRQRAPNMRPRLHRIA
jgi:hypothetical protein